MLRNVRSLQLLPVNVHFSHKISMQALPSFLLTSFFKCLKLMFMLYTYTFCQHVLEPGIPYYVTVTAGTTGGNGKEKDLIFFTNEKGS